MCIFSNQREQEEELLASHAEVGKSLAGLTDAWYAMTERAILAESRLAEARRQLAEAARCVRLLTDRTRMDRRIHRARLEDNPEAAAEALSERWQQWKTLPVWLRKEIDK